MTDFESPPPGCWAPRPRQHSALKGAPAPPRRRRAERASSPRCATRCRRRATSSATRAPPPSFLQTEQSYNVQLPSSASSMGSSPCESRGSSSGLQHRLATRAVRSPALHWDRVHAHARPRHLCTASVSAGTRATCGAPGPAARTPASGPEAAPLTHSRDRIRTPSLAIAVHAGMCFLG